MLSRNNLKAAQEVNDLYVQLKSMRNPTILRWQEMRAQYDGDIALPLPELDKTERPAVANLIALGIDQNAMSIASVRPNVIFEALSTTDVAKKRAADRRRALLGWWDMNDWDLLTRRRARHLVAYGQTVVTISPVASDKRDKRDIPHWKVRNPLSTYCAPTSNPDDMERDFAIFTNSHPMSWFQRNYPSMTSTLFSGRPNPTDKYEVLEYVDDVETVLVGIGTESEASDTYGRSMGNGTPAIALLDRIPNRTGICPVVVAERITLDRVAGQYDQVLGVERRRATLDALNTIAIFKNVFADEWAVSSSNSSSSARIIRRADGKKGVIGIVDKGQLQIVRPPLNQEIGLALDRYEAATRQSGVPAQFGGESPSNIRTGRQFDASLSAAVDMGLQESQALIARSSELEAYIAINEMKTYYGNKATSFYFGKDGKIPKKDYVPNETFDTDVVRIRYPLPGRDANGMAVAMGQKHGIGEMSLQTMRENDPDIMDAEMEAERVQSEDLTRSFMTGLEQAAAQGTMDPVKFAKILDKVNSGMDPVKATIAVDDEMKKQQADLANQQPTPQATPEQQPGLMGQPNQPVPAQAAQKPSLEDLLGQLNSQQNAVSQAPAPAPVGV